MNKALIVLGGLVISASVFGYSYSERQQGLIQQAEDALEDRGLDWSLIQSLSAAGIILGAIILLTGFLPEKWTSVDPIEE